MPSAYISANDINNMIDDQRDKKGFITDDISDGYHTFGELYEHRIALFVSLANTIHRHMTYKQVWKSKLHSDGTMFEGWFVAGIGVEPGKQITYHIPLKCWNDIDCCILDKAPEYDKHTSDDVINRLLAL